MRWQGQSVGVDDGALPGLDRAGLVRSVTTPEFDGVTFHEVLCKSALNHVPAAANLPFEWTVNPMRGCSHACRYCFARGTHEYLDLDAGLDFDTQIAVKTNVADVLRREVARPSWGRHPVALGTNTDPYQRAEGRYRLMPGIIRALTDSGTPFSILTKGTLLRRDLAMLADSSQRVEVGLAVSLALLDPDLQRSLEPGTPSPRARLDLIRAIRTHGLSVHVMVAPVVPYLTDDEAHLDALLAAIADAGAGSVTAFAMHLRRGTKPWFLRWLAVEHPGLVARYRDLYGRGAYVAPEYSACLRARLAPLLRRHGFDSGGGGAQSQRPAAGALARPAAPDPTLF
ncbi:MAG TPA: Rv2578c family radical SAM protein [Aldersonia sp.]